MSVSIIVAVTADNAIGAGGDLLFHISDDLKRFKQLTMGHPVVMGRKTFASLPKGPLPGRLNIVVSRTMEAPADNSYAVARAVQEAIAVAEKATGGEEIFIIGGGEIYRHALPLASRLYLTRIIATVPDADTFFPAIEPEEWETLETSPIHKTADGTEFQFVTLKRKE